MTTPASILDPELSGRAAYAGAFGRASIGVLFTLFDFRVGTSDSNLDLLPDVAGYLLLIAAASALVPLHRRAQSVRALAIGLSVWGAILLVADLAGGSGTVALGVLGLVAGIADLVLIWMLCGIIIDLAVLLGDDDLRNKAEVRRIVYVLFVVVVSVVLLVGAVVAEDRTVEGAGWGLVLVGLLIASVVVLILMVTLMRAARASLLASEPSKA